MKLITHAIPPRQLELLASTKETTYINQIARVEVDLEGLPMTVWACVVPGQQDDRVLGLGWQKHHQVTVYAAEDRLEINHPTQYHISTKPTLQDETIIETSASALRAWSARMRRKLEQGI